MSFDYNPYKHFEVIYRDDEYAWYCHSCGAVSNNRNDASKNIGWSAPTSVESIRLNYKNHILTFHGRTEEDFESWSTF